MLFRLLALSCCTISAAAHGANVAFCDAMTGLKSEALRTDSAQRVAILKIEPMTFACERNRSIAAQVAFCSAAMKAVGIEFTHAFPWAVYDCLRQSGIRPNVSMVDQYTGLSNKKRKKVTHLWAGWPDGARLDIQFDGSAQYPDEDPDYWQSLAQDPQFKNYWGIYRVVIWKP
jgi:hypothetical protein